MADKWKIEWFICRADASDVAYELERKLKKGEQRRDLKAGDELWRVPTSIGPVSVDQNHWAGYHLECSIEEVHQVASIPVVLEALKTCVEALRSSAGPEERENAIKAGHAAIASAEGRDQG